MHSKKTAMSIGKNLKRLAKKGYKPQQALAIALSEKAAASKKTGKKKMM